MKFKLDEKALAKAVKPQLEKKAKEANRELSKVYDRGQKRSDRDVQRDIEKTAAKHGFQGVDAKGMTAAYRAGQRTMFRAG